MKISAIQGYNYNNYQKLQANKQNLAQTSNINETRPNIMPYVNADIIKFTGLFNSTPLTAKEQKSKDINDEIGKLLLKIESEQTNAATETAFVKSLVEEKKISRGKPYKVGDKTYTLSRDGAMEFTLSVPFSEKSDDTKVFRAGRVSKLIRSTRTKDKVREVTLDVRSQDGDSFRYTEKYKDKQGKKLYTQRKIDFQKKGGLGKNTYLERNEDGSFTTYVYQGTNSFTLSRKDVYNTARMNIWEPVIKSKNLAKRPPAPKK